MVAFQRPIAFIVAAKGNIGSYDIHLIDATGSKESDLTSNLFPDGFLATEAIFSSDDSRLYFVGEWELEDT